MYKEEKNEKLLISFTFEITAYRLKRGAQWDAKHDKMEFTSISDDAVSGLSRTQCDVSSDPTGEDVSVTGKETCHWAIPQERLAI